ncbi:DEAD/DEAH box helicase [bacterium]|nr:DEAD/DEAH box helicase [bacterium]
MASEPAIGKHAVDLPTLPDDPNAAAKARIRPKPTADTVLFKDRLLLLLQPPLDGLFDGRQLAVPFEPFPYQLEGIAFLMPRHAALLADEMGLGKTAQAILSLRLLFHQGQIRQALLICPKPLMHNWARELKLWAPDLPYEPFDGDAEQRRTTWLVSNCPLKLINYETLTRDADLAADPRVYFDAVVLDEAQRIKNKESKTAQTVRSIRRGRSWAISGTPVENSPDDLVNLFAFLDPGRIPPDTPPKHLPRYTSDCILRRTKDLVQSDMPPKTYRDLEVDLTPAQRQAYSLAEEEGVIHLNELGETISVQHVFQLVMRLKQICNFDPLTGESAKLEQLVTDMEEVAASGRKAIVFSQWVEPLEVLAKALEPFGPLQYHGRIPQAERTPILDQFKADPTKHVILMSYGTGSVGLNLQFTNYVFLFDRWWNPAIEDQAINRAHRVGQRHPVTVTRFIAGDTIEQRIALILDQKRQVFHDLLAQADKPATLGLNEDEIFGLFDLKARPRRGAA